MTGGHRTVLCSTSSLLCHAVLPWCQGVPAADCLILPDFSETDINNLFALLYDDGHRFRGAKSLFPLTNLGFCPNRLDPPPRQRLGHPQQKKTFDVYFAFWAILFCNGDGNEHL